MQAAFETRLIFLSLCSACCVARNGTLKLYLDHTKRTQRRESLSVATLEHPLALKLIPVSSRHRDPHPPFCSNCHLFCRVASVLPFNFIIGASLDTDTALPLWTGVFHFAVLPPSTLLFWTQLLFYRVLNQSTYTSLFYTAGSKFAQSWIQGIASITPRLVYLSF